jgi:glycosyltransferase involved in cell wall biosynthesis
VVASTAASLPEVVGDAGLLVPARDSGALAAEVARILDDPKLARDLGARGRERACRFTWERAATEMAAVLGEALVS